MPICEFLAKEIELGMRSAGTTGNFLEGIITPGPFTAKLLSRFELGYDEPIPKFKLEGTRFEFIGSNATLDLKDCKKQIYYINGKKVVFNPLDDSENIVNVAKALGIKVPRLEGMDYKARNGLMALAIFSFFGEESDAAWMTVGALGSAIWGGLTYAGSGIAAFGASAAAAVVAAPAALVGGVAAATTVAGGYAYNTYKKSKCTDYAAELQNWLQDSQRNSKRNEFAPLGIEKGSAKCAEGVGGALYNWASGGETPSVIIQVKKNLAANGLATVHFDSGRFWFTDLSDPKLNQMALSYDKSGNLNISDLKGEKQNPEGETAVKLKAIGSKFRPIIQKIQSDGTCRYCKRAFESGQFDKKSLKEQFNTGADIDNDESSK